MPSSVIKEFSYHDGVLRVTYLSGLVYEYYNVPEDVFKQMKIAGSKGRYLNFFIKGTYKFKKIA